MGRIIRRTVTITITESWTIVWTDDVQADDMPQSPAPAIVPAPSQPQEEEDEMILPAITTGATMDAQPTDISLKSGSQRKRNRRRHTAE